MAAVTVSEVLRRFIPGFLREAPALSQGQRRAIFAITHCRTAVMGGHLHGCGACGSREFAWHSCNHRSCPLCGRGATFEWVNDNTGTGLAVNGTGNIPVFASDNVAATSISNVTVTPILNGCTGAAANFSMTVHQFLTGGYVIFPETFCQAGSNIPILHLRDYMVNENDGGVWTDISTTTTGSRFDPITGYLNTNGLGQGTYIFRYYLTGMAPCANDARDITIIIERCCPEEVCLPVTIQKF